MKKHIIPVICLLLSALSLPADAQENSIVGQLYAKANQSQRSTDYWAVCRYILENGDSEGIFNEALKKGYERAVAEKSPNSMAQYYDCQAEYKLAMGELDQYMPLKSKALDIYRLMDNKDKEAECCIYIGNYFNATGQYDSARIYLEKMDRYAASRPQATSYNIMLTCLADTYYRMGNIDSAVSKELASARYSAMLADTLTLLGSYRALGMYCRTQGRLEEALKHYNLALGLLTGNSSLSGATEEKAALYTNLSVLCNDMKQASDALRYATQARLLANKIDNELATVQIYANIGMVFIENGDLRQAADCLQQSMQTATRMNDKNMMLRNAGYLVQLKNLQGQVDSVDYYIRLAHRLIPSVRMTPTLLGYYQAELQALVDNKRYKEALHTGKMLEQTNGIGQRKFILQGLYASMRQCYTQLGMYKEALEYAALQTALTDSLQSTERNKALQELNVKYETKEKELKLLQLESERRISAERNKTRITLLLLAIVVVLAASAALVARQRKRAERLKRYAAEKEKELELLQYDTELSLTRKYLEGMESERNRLAKELHDGISNDLYLLEMRCQNNAESPNPDFASTLSKIREDVRSISHELMPPSFSELTLKEILQNYADNLAESSGIETEFQADPAEADWSRLPQQTSMLLYRTVQEAVGNILKHAGATHIYIGIEQTDDGTLLLYIHDNGNGLTDIAGDGIGLRTMQERIATLHGTLHIAPGKGGKGTLVRCTLPIQQ